MLHIRAKKHAKLRCSVDGQHARRCKRTTRLKLSTGPHSIAVWAVLHGRSSKKRHVSVIVPQRAPAGVSVGDQPVAIAAAGSNVWVSTADQAVRIDATTRKVTKRVTVGGQLGGIAATDTDVWVSVYDGGQVAHVANGAVVGRTSVGGAPSGVAFDAGSVWVGNLNGWVNRIDPANGHVVATVNLPSGVSTLLPVGNLLWAGLQDGSLAAINPQTNTRSPARA